MMKHFFKGTAAIAITMIVNIIVNVICNMNGVELNTIITTFVSTICAIEIYHGLIKN